MGEPLGQHFLGDSEVIKEFCGLVDWKDKRVLEVGGGTGSLSVALAKSGPKKLTILEKDESLIPKLKERLDDARTRAEKADEPFCDVQIVAADVHGFSFKGFDWVVGNIPFYLSSDIIFKAIGPDCKASGLFFLQKEFAQRLESRPDADAWGRLSVNAQNHADIKLAMDVSRYSFTPPPEVDVAVVILRRRKPLAIDEHLVELLFSHKNQKVKKAYEHSAHMLKLDKQEAKEKAAALPFADLRVRELTLEQWVELSARGQAT